MFVPCKYLKILLVTTHYSMERSYINQLIMLITLKKFGQVATIVYIKLPTSNSFYGMSFILTIYFKIFNVVEICNLHRYQKV
jgi:hypothetical protein